jgi:hypothetical protein
MAKKKVENEPASQKNQVNAAWAKLINHILSQSRAGHFKNVPGSELTEEDLLILLNYFEEED